MKDDFIGDLMVIAAGSLGMLKLAKGGETVPELPDIEDEAAAVLGGEFGDMWDDLDRAGTDVEVELAAWKEEIAGAV